MDNAIPQKTKLTLLNTVGKNAFASIFVFAGLKNKTDLKIW